MENQSEKFTIPELKEHYKNYMQKFDEFSKQISDFQTEGKKLEEKQRQTQYDQLVTKIKADREEFYNIIDFFAKYDQTLYAKKYDEMLEKANQAKNILFPKKKFAFSLKAQKQPNNTKHSDTAPILTKQVLEESKEISLNSEVSDLIIKDITDQTLRHDADSMETKNKNNVIIENISNCSIYLLTNFKACYIKNIKHTKIYVGSVSGGTHITSCEDSDVYIITHQLRIHETRDSRFNVMINSNPIIEKSAGLVFYPLKIDYKGYEENVRISKIDTLTNKYDQVQDFQWLKKEKSPNFTTDDKNILIRI